MHSYDYAHRKGMNEITWDGFAALTAQLAEKLAPIKPDMIIGIARAGLIPATTVACMLRREMYPVRITRRVNDEVVYETPVWKVPVSPDVAGKTVIVVDEIADSGQTLRLVAERVRELGAGQVFTACLVSHSWADPKPDQVVLVTDELVIFPWDRQVLMDGQWQMHPELVEALRLQGRASSPDQPG